MTIVTITSAKGGVGKSTLALNLAYAMAKRGVRTLLVDADPQGAIGLSLTRALAEADGLASVLLDDVPIDQVWVQTKLAGLCLVPFGVVAPGEARRVADALAASHPLEAVLRKCSKDFDLILVDTQGGVLESTVGALAGSDFAVVAVQCEPLALRSLPMSLDVIGAARSTGSAVRLAGVVMTMADESQEASAQVVAELERSVPRTVLMTPAIPRSPEFLAASAAGVPLGLLSRRPPAAAFAFDQLAAELELRTQLVTEEEDADGPVSLLV